LFSREDPKVAIGDGPSSPQSNIGVEDLDTTAKTINDEDLAAGLSQQFYEMSVNMPRHGSASRQLNTLVVTTHFAPSHNRPDSPTALASSNKFPQPFSCKGDYCNLDISNMGKLVMDAHHASHHVASKLFSEEEIIRLRKDPKFNKMMEFNSSGLGLAEISMRSIALARKEQRGKESGAMNSSSFLDSSDTGRIYAWRDNSQDDTASPSKDAGKAHGGSFLDRISAPKQYNDFLEDESLITNPSLHYEQVRVCGVCYNVYQCLDWARTLLRKAQSEPSLAATVKKRRQQQLAATQSAQSLIPHATDPNLNGRSSDSFSSSLKRSGRRANAKNATAGGGPTWKSQLDVSVDRAEMRSKLAPLENYIRGESNNIRTLSPPRQRSVSPSSSVSPSRGDSRRSPLKSRSGKSRSTTNPSPTRSAKLNQTSKEDALQASSVLDGTIEDPHIYRGYILLACPQDDENFQSFKQLLADNMFRLKWCKDGREAVNEITNHWDDYDCVIMERDLPLLDAFSIAKTTREHEKSIRIERANQTHSTAESGKFLHHRIPLIVYTNATAPADLTKYMRSDMDGCISKPIDTASVLNTIRAAVPHHLAEIRKLDQPMEQPKTTKKVLKMGLLGELEGSVDSASAALKSLPISMKDDSAGSEFQGIAQLDADTKIPFLVINGSKYSRIRQSMANDRQHKFFNLVVCHDVFDTFERMKILLQPIVQRYQAIQVLVWNYPGQALTEWRSSQTLNNEYMAACLNELLGQVGESGTKDFATDQPFYFLGFGYGANIAAYYLANYRVQNVRGLLSVNGWSFVDSYLAGVMHDCINIFQSTPDARPDLPVYFFSRFLFSKEYLAKVSVPLALNIYTAVYNSISLAGRMQLCRGLLHSLDIRPLLKTLDCPLICLHSHQDAFVRPLHIEPYVSKRNGEVRSIYQALNYPSTTCVIWFHGGHEIFQENRKQLLLLLEQVLTGYHEVHEITFPSASAVQLDSKYSTKDFKQAMNTGTSGVSGATKEQSLEDKFTHSVLSIAARTSTGNGRSSTSSPSRGGQMAASQSTADPRHQTNHPSQSHSTRALSSSHPLAGHTASLEASWSQYSDTLLAKEHHILTLDSTKQSDDVKGKKAKTGQLDGSAAVGYVADVKQYPEVKEYMNWRLKRNKKRLQRLQIAAQVIQTAYRAYLARKFVRNIRRIKAARLIQRIFRGFTGRRKFYKHVKRLWAAISIQTCWRGYFARKWFFLVRVKMAAAADIQRMYRGHLGRKRVRKVRAQQYAAAAVIQAMFRRFKARREAWLKRRMRNCVITIQRIFRGFMGRKKANTERDKYIFSKSQSQGIEFGRQMLLEHKLHVTRLQSDVTLLTQEKVAAEEQIEALLEEIATFEDGVRTLEKEMHQLSKVESEAAAFMDEDSKFELREQKMRLDREFGEMLAKIGHRKEMLTDLEKKLSAIDKARQGKEEDLRTLERKLVVLLEDQQKELQAIRRKQDIRGQMLAASHQELSQVSANGGGGSGGAMVPAGSGMAGGQQQQSSSGPSLHEKRQAAQLMQSTETLMKFGFMSMSMTYFSSLNMIKALRTVSAQDTVMAALADVHTQRAVGMDGGAGPVGGGGGGHPAPGVSGGGAGGAGSTGKGGLAHMPALKAGQLPGQQSSLQVSTWSVDDVAKWLQTLSLGQYAEAFIDAAVDGEFLYDLNDDDLKNTLGIEHRLHRKKILNCIARLKMAEAANDARLTRVTYAQNNNLSISNTGEISGTLPNGMNMNSMPSDFAAGNANFPESALGADEDRNINGPKVSVPELLSLVRHSKFSQIKDAIDYLPNKSFDRSLVQAQFVPDHGTVYLSSYERLPFHLNKTDEHGNTMLMLAAQNGNMKICKYLLAKGANPNHQNHFGQTPAHFAIAYRFFDLSTYLFENGADDTLENKYGLSPYDGLSNDGGDTGADESLLIEN
jgi:CheY-like chemotaxis protein